MRVGFVLFGLEIRGAEKRCAALFKYLVKNNPKNYHLIINNELYKMLNQGGYMLDTIPNVHLVRIKKTVNADCKKNVISKSILSPASLLLPIWIKTYIKTLWIYSQVKELQKRLSLNILHGVWGGVYAITPYFFSEKAATVISYTDVSFNLLERNFFHLLSSYHLGIKRATQVDLLSNEIKDGLIQRGYNLTSERTNVTPCSFIDYNKYRPSNKKGNLVVFAGALRPFKNPSLFIESIPKVLKKIDDVYFYLLGRGPLETQIESRIRELNLENKIKTGFVSDTSEILSKSLIFASLQEGSNYPSQSLLEAMACENAIIATDVGETWKLVNPSVGFRVPLNSDKIAEAIIFLLRNHEKAIEMGKNARRKVRKEHTIEKYTEYIQNVYKKAYNKL
ncbi:hypothetical protein ES703_38863 [subsurface metagenome]